MAAIDYKSAIDTQAWALLEATDSASDPTLQLLTYFPVNCRRKDDNKQPMQQAMQVGVNDKSYIRIEVQNSDGIARNPPHVFGMNRTSFTKTDCDIVVPCTVKLIVEMGFDKSVATKANRFASENLVRSTLLATYPKFGLTYVHTFSMTDIKRDKVIDAKLMAITTLTLSFNLRPHLSQLVA
jgi:hypothetical protein